MSLSIATSGASDLTVMVACVVFFFIAVIVISLTSAAIGRRNNGRN